MQTTTTTLDARIRLHAVDVLYERREALRGVDLDIGPGELVAITGPNGAGKSTLLEVVAGVRAPTRGRRLVDGGIAFVPQRAAVSPRLPLTARDVVEVGTWGRRRSGRRSRRSVDEAMDRTAVSSLERIPFAALSGGQQQRVLLAQGLAGEADILLLDEPTSALDADSVARVRGVLRAEAERGAVVLCVTHDGALVADAARELALRDGAVVPADEGSVSAGTRRP